MNLFIKELITLQEMLSQLEMIRHLYPKLSLEKYEHYLQEMVPHNYTQIALFENDVCLGLTGCWSATKLWTGKYLEIDNFVVNPKYRSNGIGKMLTDYVEKKAIELNCSSIVLDAFTGNFERIVSTTIKVMLPKDFIL